MAPKIPLKSITGLGLYVFRMIELFIGVKFRRENLNTRNSFDAAMIILATYFVFPIYSGYLDVFAQAVQGGAANTFAIEGFRLAFLLSSVWLILIALFSKAKFPILKFVLLIIPGLVLGIVMTYLLTEFIAFFKGVWNLDETTLFIMTIYPLLFSYFVRGKINQRTKPHHNPQPPRITEARENVYVE